MSGRTTEENLRAALAATTSVIDAVKAQNTALADALEKIAALHPAVLSDGDFCDCEMHTIAGRVLRAAGRLP